MSSAVVDHETSILEGLIVSPESAQALLAIRFASQDEERMRQLIERNNRGTISDTEKDEMEAYSRIGSLLAILQAKARLFLKTPPDNAPDQQ
jgi:hypothetical protein